MRLQELQGRIPAKLYEALEKRGIDVLRPCQEKAIEKGLLEQKSILVCSPTASGKTLVAELACLSAILDGRGKAIYIVPLKALASEKFKEFKERYSEYANIVLSMGDIDSADSYLIDYDIIVCTAEKLDSLIRHHSPWLKFVSVVVVDEAHLINDTDRGPTLEILLTILRMILKKVQIVALSATIGNPGQIAGWLDAGLVIDDWRPVKLLKGVYYDGEVEFDDED